jgi:TetR/AcrR family transcriptional regulator
MELHEQDRDERRKRIQRAARRVFGQHGFAGATIERIARLAGLSVGAIYLHFRGKEELYVSLVEERLAELADRIELVAQPGGDPHAQLRQAWCVLLDERAIWMELAQRAWHVPDAGTRAAAGPAEKSTLACALERVMAPIGAILQRGADAGQFRSEGLAHAPAVLLAQLLGVGAFEQLAPQGHAHELGQHSFAIIERSLGCPTAERLHS